MCDRTTLWFNDVMVATATAGVAGILLPASAARCSERRGRGGDDHLAVVVWLMEATARWGATTDKSPPPRATRRFREAAASTCRGVSSAPAGCEARLCAHDRKRSKLAQRSSEDI